MDREEIIDWMKSICNRISSEIYKDVEDIDIESLSEAITDLAQCKGALNLLDGKDLY